MAYTLCVYAGFVVSKIKGKGKKKKKKEKIQSSPGEISVLGDG
jgi:hypothetical protein